jgi:hypothetical protein
MKMIVALVVLASGCAHSWQLDRAVRARGFHAEIWRCHNPPRYEPPADTYSVKKCVDKVLEQCRREYLPGCMP